MPTPTPSVTSDVTSAVTLMACSCARGITSISPIPTSGMKTARVNAQSSNQFMCVLPFDSEDSGEEQREGEQPYRGEQEQGVALHAPGLNGAQRTAGIAGAGGKRV